MNVYSQRFKTMEDRFWEKVDRKDNDSCWNWKASTTRGGYGQFWYKGMQLKAHRVAWELVNGAIPDGMYCLHGCDNPACCNPAHIRLGSLVENMQDAMDRNRIAKGERQGSAKLTIQDVIEIRSKYKPVRGSISRLASEYNVGFTAIREIVMRESWKHVK